MQDHDFNYEIACLRKELTASLARNKALEKENQDLRQEVFNLRSQASSLKPHNIDRESSAWKTFQSHINSNSIDASPQKHKHPFKVTEPNSAMQNQNPKQESARLANSKERPPPRVPKPPPTQPAPAVSPLFKEVDGYKGQDRVVAPPPPPPPPQPSMLLADRRALRRVPQVMELYRLLTRRDAQADNKTNSVGSQPVAYPRNMIGEIENRSSYLSTVKSEVETHRELIIFLTKEVEDAAYSDISEVDAFVKWLDTELSYLVDERAVLKHFPQWPEAKADALREAACSYRDMKNLESEVLSFKDDPKQPLSQALRRIQALEDRWEQSVSNIEKTRDSVSKKYKTFKIPWQWMLETGLVGQVKLSSMTLVKEYMKRIIKEIQYHECSYEGDLMLQGVKFAFRVHQFAGGFDADTVDVFEELRKAGKASTEDRSEPIA